MYKFYNPNPDRKLVGDCVIRAISTITGADWESVYTNLAFQGLLMRDMPSSNAVWGTLLANKGFKREVIPNTCPECYTIRDFCNDYQIGAYIVATGSHVVAVIDGDYYDTSDSGDEIPIYYWRKI